MSEYYIQYKNKVRSLPYCCALLLDPRMPTTSISLSCMRDGTKAVVLLPSQSPQCYRCVVGIFSALLLFNTVLLYMDYFIYPQFQVAIDTVKKLYESRPRVVWLLLNSFSADTSSQNVMPPNPVFPKLRFPDNATVRNIYTDNINRIYDCNNLVINTNT